MNTNIRFGSVCSGIEAASVAWPFWEAAWFSEIEPFPCTALKHHYPDVPNHGDMTTLPERILFGEVEAPDIFCGGTPCQAFSVAGNRKSLDDARGNLSLTFCEIADAIDSVRYVRNEQPTIIFWENVPGVLNTTDNAFGCFLAKLAGESCELQPPGGRWTDAGCVHGPKRTIAWRVLDAQYFGLAQRRRRLYICAVQNSFRAVDPRKILFEFEGVRRDIKPWNEHEKTIHTTEANGSPFDMLGFGQYGTGMTASTILARDYKDAKDLVVTDDGKVRKLTPTECERLQGFPDNYTNIPWRNKPEAPDGPRYKALGNSWAVPVVNWIGNRINEALNG